MRIAITGAGGDIGSAIALCLEGKGMDVFRGTHEACDVTSEKSVKSFFRDVVEAFDGELDGLVTCHGAPRCIKPTLDLTDEEFQRVVEIDLVGTMRCCREAARYMLPAGRGSIVMLSSMHAIATYPQRAAYAAAKAGVVGLTKALAVEWARNGLSVNCVLPGQICGTRRTENLQHEKVHSRSPSCKLPTKTDVANAVAFLLHGGGVNGHALVVDDGWTASAWYDSHA